MIRLALVLFHATALLLAATAPAHAGPLVAGIAAFMATPLGGIVVGIGSMLIGQVVKSLFGSKQAQRTNGTQLSVRLGGDGPFSFPLGPAATAGTKFYVGSWGNPGEAPNAYFVEAFAASDLPIAGWKGFWVNDQRAVFGTYDATLGYPVLDFRRNGVDHVWIKHYRGVQLSADPYLLSKFGAHPVYPFGTDMVGRGVAYFIVTTRRPGPDDQDLLSSPARVLAEPDSILLYDIRKDTTAGGSGGHRWGDYSTYEPSANLMVQGYNVARGISYGGEWVFGGQNWPAFRLPSASWMAAMNACDLAIALKDGGTEPQFHGGGMVDVSEIDSASVLNELMKSASAKIAEGGGIYKIRVGAPGVPVMHFTDEDIVVTREHGWAPFKGIGETFNTVNWTYSEPVERWANKPGPQYKDAALVAADRGRTLPMPFDLPWTQSNTTGQRLVQAALKNSRRFDTHALYLPPIAWLIEALDTVSWTSAEAGYVAKEFEVDEIGGGSDLIQFASLRENDPEDYDWSPDDDQRPYAVAPMITIRPPPQEVSGFFVEPAIAYDSEGRPRRPAIDVFWSAASVTVDVRAVRITVALPDEADEDEPGTLVWDGEAPRPELGSARLVEALLPNQAYLVQIQYTPHSGRATVESGWLAVTTPDVRYTSLDIEIDEIRDEVLESVGELDRETRINVRDLIEDKRAQILLAVQGQLADYSDRQLIRRALVSQDGANRAEYKEDILVATGPGSAIVTRIEELRAEVFDPDTGLPATAEAVSLLSAEVHNPDTGLEALANMVDLLSVSYGDVSADGLLSVEVGIAPAGVSSRAILSTRATAGGAVASAAMMLDSRIISGTLTSEVLLVGGRISLVASTSPTATKRGMLVVDGDNVYIDNARIRSLTAVNIATNSLDATVINVASIFAQNAAIAGQLTVGASILIDGPNGRILVSD